MALGAPTAKNVASASGHASGSERSFELFDHRWPAAGNRAENAERALADARLTGTE